MIKTVYGLFTMLNYFFHGYCLHSHEMHALCGSTINVTSGKLELYTAKLSSEEVSCQVSVVSKFKHRLMFYFSMYNLPDDCRTINISLFDGYANSSILISGVRELLCGRSPVLTNKDDCLFTTSTSTMTVSFTRTTQNNHRPANFTLVYSSFHTGACDDEEEINCSVRNSSKFKHACFDNVEICKTFNDVICYTTPVSGKSSKIVQYILCGLLGIVALFGLRFFYHQYKHGEEERRTTIDSDGNCHKNVKLRLTKIFCNVQSLVRKDSTDLENTSDSLSYTDTSTHEYDSHRTTNTNTSILETEIVPSVQPSAPELEQTQCELPAPPYEETPVPSYTEVMSNQDKYVVH